MKLKSILSVIAIVLSIAAIILSIITMTADKDKPITDAYQIGLGAFFDDAITEMYADEGNNPNLRGSFYDEDVLKNVRELFSIACFQATDNAEFNAKSENSSVSFISFKGERAEYGFYVCNGVIKIKINETTDCYHTNIGYTLNKIIYEITLSFNK